MSCFKILLTSIKTVKVSKLFALGERDGLVGGSSERASMKTFLLSSDLKTS